MQVPIGVSGVVGEQPDVDHAPDPADIYPGQVGLIREELDHLTGYAEAHSDQLLRRSPAAVLGRGTGAGARPGGTHQVQHDPHGLIDRRRDRRAQPYPLSTLAGSQPTTRIRPASAPSMSSMLSTT